MPFVWRISRYCEEFHCRPSETVEEMARTPVGLLDLILEARVFADAYRQKDQPKDRRHENPLMDLCDEIEYETRE